MTAYGYIRKSVVHDPARMLSPEMQQDAIHRLAAANGDEDVVILSDLDVSGTKGRSARPAWDELLRAVEDGDAHAVYSYSLSRFARSVGQLDHFFKLCQKHSVPIRMSKDHIDTSHATGRLISGILAQLAEFEADIASERVRDAFAAKRAKDPTWVGPGNKRYGSRDSEDPHVVIEAFREAGSFDGAARLLNSRGVPSRVEGRHWSGSVVRGIVKEHAPSEVGPYVRRGSPAGKRSFKLASLVACSECGGFLTGSRDSRRGDVRYQCARSRVIPHARGWVNESKLLPVVVEELGHIAPEAFMPTSLAKRGSASDEAALAALAAKRLRVAENYDDGLYDKATRDAKLVEISLEESKYTALRAIRRMKVPPLVADFVHEDGRVTPADLPDKVNRYLRGLFKRITVDMSEPALRGPSNWVPSVGFEWRDESMRRRGASPTR